MAVRQKRAESEGLGGCPVDAATGLDRLGARIEEALNRAVNVETLGHRGEVAADPFQFFERDAGDAAARRIAHLGDLDAGPGAVEPVGLVGAVTLPGLELGFELGPPRRLGTV